MKQIGACLRANKEGFYGCGYTPFEEHTQDWGLTTVDEHHNRLYLHVFDWPVDGIVRVNGLKTKITSATLVSKGEKLAFTQSNPSIHITGPRSAPVPYDTVIRLDLGGPLDVDNDTVGEINDGGIALQASRASLKGVVTEKPYDGSTKLPVQIGGWTADGASASWMTYIPSPGKRDVTVSYASTVDTAGQSFTVSSISSHRVTATVHATQANWSEFRPFTIGSIDFPAAGYYTITLQPDGKPTKELFKLLWIHLGEGGK